MLAKQVLSQLSYTPTKTTLILNHLPTFRIPIGRKIVMTVPNKLQSSCRCLCQILRYCAKCFCLSHPLSGLWKSGPSSGQNPKPAGPGRERYRCLRQERIIKARDSAMLAT